MREAFEGRGRGGWGDFLEEIVSAEAFNAEGLAPGRGRSSL